MVEFLVGLSLGVSIFLVLTIFKLEKDLKSTKEQLKNQQITTVKPPEPSEPVEEEVKVIKNSFLLVDKYLRGEVELDGITETKVQ